MLSRAAKHKVAIYTDVTYTDASAALAALADTYGIATSYWSADGDHITVSDDTLLKTLRALDVHVDPTEESCRAAIQHFHDEAFARPLPPCVVAIQGDAHHINVHVHDGATADVTLTLEDGSQRTIQQVENWAEPRTIDGITWGEATFVLPEDLPLGWHTLHLHSVDGGSEGTDGDAGDAAGVDNQGAEPLTASCDVVITPRRLSTADRYVEHPVGGVMGQLYSVRSEESWGIGDFHDLAELARITAEHAHADFLLINPLHAAEPFPPIEDSPYLPTTRRFINPLYIHVESIPEYADLDSETRGRIDALAAPLKDSNHSPDYIRRDPIYSAKLYALRQIHALPRSPERDAAYQDYLAHEGHGLDDFARWCAAQENRDDDATIDFYRWLQWICDQQFHAASTAAYDAGMSIGIMADLAVGVHPAGADATNLAGVLAPGASVGAPADGYNQNGQDWSQPPWHPRKLAEAGYRPWRDMLRTVLRHSGGIRVDHILGLFRLWWIPRGQSPLTGTYVHYDYNALVGILALEAERAGAVVIGEDLGTFEQWVQDVLAARGIMGTSILWFERSPSVDGPRHQDEYRSLALSSVTTHDLPPTAGYLYGEHIALRDRLGLLIRDTETENSEDLAWQNRILARIGEYGLFDGTALDGHDFDGAARDERGDITDLLVAMHRYIAGTPSALTCASLVDMVGDIKAQNQPGTTHDPYPNWCIPLCDAANTPILIHDLPALPLFRAVAEASRRR